MLYYNVYVYLTIFYSFSYQQLFISCKDKKFIPYCALIIQ